jgi:LacI family transcriptional regulator
MNRPTLKDIATRAGVSVSTVSYALNDESTLPLAVNTKVRIRAIARELGYVPNSVARSLQSRSSQTIGVLLNKPLTTPRYAEIAQGLNEGLAARGFHLALLGGESAARCVDDARGGRLDGLVFIGHDDQEVPGDLATQVTEHHIPFVTLDCGPATSPGSWSSVDFDYATGVEQVLEHLADQGVTRIVHVRPDVTSRADRTRVAAVETTTVVRGMELRTIATGMTDELLARVDGQPSESAEYTSGMANRLDAGLAWLDGASAATTALVCSWGSDVEAVYHWAAERDGRLRVAALAGGALDPRFWRGLTYSRLPLHEAGIACAGLIIDAHTKRASPTRRALAPSLDIGDAPHQRRRN